MAMSEEELEQAFLQDSEVALGLLHIEFRHQICRYIKSEGWSLQAADVRDIYQITMAEMVKVIRKPGFDGHKPLKIVYTIACNRTIDALRRKGHQPKTDVNGALKHIANDLKGTKTNLEWIALDTTKWATFRKELIEAIGTLPDKLQIVARAFVDNYETFREREIYIPLARAVFAVTKENENVATIKTQWHEAKKRIAKILTGKGFLFLDSEDLS